MTPRNHADALIVALAGRAKRAERVLAESVLLAALLGVLAGLAGGIVVADRVAHRLPCEVTP